MAREIDYQRWQCTTNPLAKDIKFVTERDGKTSFWVSVD
jgi:hypothetical protein